MRTVMTVLAVIGACQAGTLLLIGAVLVTRHVRRRLLGLHDATCCCDALDDVPADELDDTEIAIRFAEITGTRFEGLM